MEGKTGISLKKRVWFRITALLILVFFLAALSGCGERKISGTYVSEHNSAEYFVFSGESKVSYYQEDNRLDGAYYVVDDVIMTSFDAAQEENAVQLLTIKNNKTIYLGMVAFVKKNALVDFLKGIWSRYWLQILIGLTVLGAISSLVEKIAERRK